MRRFGPVLRSGVLLFLSASHACVVWPQAAGTPWLLDRSWGLISTDPDSAFYYADVAAEQARIAGDSAQMAVAFRRMGMSLEVMERFDEALRYLTAALAIDERMSNTRAVVSSEQKVGALLTRIGRYDEALTFLLRALDRSVSLGEEASIARCHNLLARVFQSTGRYDEAANHLFRGLDIRKRLKDEEGVIASTLSLADLYAAMQRHDEAIATYRAHNALRRDHGDDAGLATGLLNLGAVYHRLGRDEALLACIDSALVLIRQHDDRSMESVAMSNRAVALAGLGRTGEATVQYKEVIALAEANGDEAGRAEAQLGLASIMDSPADRAAAERMLKDVLAWCRQTGHRAMELEAISSLADNLQAQGRSEEALALHIRARALQDSLFSEHVGNALVTAEMREKYDAAEREERIADLQTEVSLREEQRRRRTLERNIMVLSSIALLVFLGLLLRNLQHRKRIMRQREDLHRRQVNAMLKEQEVHSLEAMLDGQRMERRRIAQDLHDRLGSTMSAIRMHCSTIADGMRERAVDDTAGVDRLAAMIDDAVGEVRRIAHDMANTTLENAGLESALRALGSSLHQPGRFEVEVITHGCDRRIDQRLEIALYKVVQELVANVLKHARARNLTIQLIRNDDILNLMVEDDGVGSVEEPDLDGMGLGGVRTRVKDLGGEVQWDSQPGSGTSVIVDVPLASD